MHIFQILNGTEYASYKVSFNYLQKKLKWVHVENGYQIIWQLLDFNQQ
jgi:hypothetical protein